MEDNKTIIGKWLGFLPTPISLKPEREIVIESHNELAKEESRKVREKYENMQKTLAVASGLSKIPKLWKDYFHGRNNSKKMRGE